MTLSASIVISLLLSLTATPTMAARLIDDHHGGPKPRDTAWKRFWGRVADGFERGFDRLLKTYEGSLAWALDNGRLVLFMLATTICLTVFLYIKVPKGFFPQEDTGTLIGGVQVDQASSFALTAAKFRHLQAIVMHDPAVATATSFTQSAGGFMFISLKPRAQRPHVTGDMVIGRLTPKLARIAGAQLFLQSAQDLQVGGRQSSAQYQYTLQSDDLTALRTWSNKLLEQLKTYPDLTQVNTDQQSNALESYVTVDRKTASRLGITSKQIDSTLSDAFGQSFASIIYNPLNQYHVVMEIAQKYQGDPTALKSIYVTPASGASTSTSSTSVTRASTTSGGGVRTSASSGGVGTTSGSSAAAGGASTTLGTTSSLGGSALSVGSAAGTSGTFASGGTGATSSSALGLGATTSGSTGANLLSNSSAGGSTSTASTGGNLATAGLASNSQAQSSSSTASQNLSAVGGGGSSTATSGASAAGSSGGSLSGAGVQRSTTGGAVAASSGVAISTSRETMIPLSAIASWALQNTPLAVNHQGQSVAATLSFNLAPGKSLSDAQRDVANAVQVIGMPGNVIGSFQGTAQVYQQSLSNEPILIAAALVAVYIVLGVLYESYIHPLTVLSTLPSAGVGAVLAMMIFGVDFSIISLIGVVLLIGIVKKNAIMIIDFALVAEREQGLSSRDAIYQACVLRFRPILMTTCAAILGALPLALGLGEGGRAAPAARHLHHRGPDRQPGADAADHAGGLSLPGPPEQPQPPRPPAAARPPRRRCSADAGGVIELKMPDRANERLAAPFPLDGGRGGDGGGCTTPMEEHGWRLHTPFRQAQRQHPHPCPSPIEGEGKRWRAATFLALALTTSACLVGPNYQRPTTPITPQFKEAQGWVPSQPAAAIDKGAWWSVYDDPVLDGLERRVAISNQNVAQAVAAYRQARQIVKEATSTLFPTVTANGQIQDTKSNNGGGSFSTTAGGTVVSGGGGGGSVTTYSAALEASWAPDLWGRVRRQIESNTATAQADAADIVNARLSAQGTLATAYFELRATDAQMKLLRDTVADYQRYLTLTTNQYRAGTVSRANVLSAQTQLLGAQAQLTDDESARAQFEHAIAVLDGEPPAALTIVPTDVLATAVPVAPADIPSTLLQRRPDIAAAERQVDSANALIGVAEAAFYPDVTLTGSESQNGSNFGQLFNASSNIWSVGGTIAETVLDFGERRAAVRAASAVRDQAVANYRQTVLTAFQNVEDRLAILRTLQREIVQRQQTAAAARAAYLLDLNQYRAGTVDYTTVITGAATAFNADEQVISVQEQRLEASATLIQDLGGGWDASELPSRHLPKSDDLPRG